MPTWDWRSDLRQLITEAIGSYSDVSKQTVRCSLSLRHFAPALAKCTSTAEEAKEDAKLAVFYDGADLSVFMLSIGHKTSDLTTRYFILLQSC